jgi:hypothetical protein
MFAAAGKFLGSIKERTRWSHANAWLVPYADAAGAADKKIKKKACLWDGVIVNYITT